MKQDAPEDNEGRASQTMTGSGKKIASYAMVKNVGVEKQIPVDDMETACKFARREKVGTHGKNKTVQGPIS